MSNLFGLLFASSLPLLISFFSFLFLLLPLHSQVRKTIAFTSPIRRVRLNVRMWAVGDWKDGATIRLLVDNFGPISGVTKFGNTCDKNVESWRESTLTWNPKATEDENQKVCFYDLIVEFDLGASWIQSQGNEMTLLCKFLN